MIKRILQIALVAICLSLLGYAIYILTKGTGNREDLMAIIPSDAHTIMPIQPGKPDNDGNVLLPLLSDNSISSVEKTMNDLNLAATQVESWKACTDISHSILLFNDQSCTHPIFVIPLKRDITAADLITAFSPHCKKREYESITIASNDLYFCSVIAGHFIISNASSVIEKLILDYNLQKTMAFQKNDAEVVTEFLAGDKDVLLRMNEYDWWSAELGTSDIGLKTLFGEILSDTSDTDLFVPESPSTCGRRHFELPQNLMSAEFQFTGNYSPFWREMNRFYSKQHAPSSVNWQNAWNEISDTSETLLEWREGFQGVMGIASGLGSIAHVSCIGAKDTVIVTSRIAPLIAKALDEYPGVVKISNHLLLERNFPKGAEGNYATEKNHVLYFGSSPVNLFNVLTDSTTIEESVYGSWEEACEQAFCWYYWSDSNVPTYLKNLGRYHFSSQRISAHIRLENNLSYLKLFFHDQETTEPKETPSQFNEAECFDVTNHADASKEKLCFTDAMVERFNSQSQSLFQVNIEGDLLGEVVEIDALKNHKLQTAFTTTQKLFVIDRKGNPLSGFPIATPNAITSGLLVTDYNSDKNYRLILGTADGQIQNYDSNGNPVPGWQFASVQPHITAIAYTRCANEDHLIAVQQDGQILVLKRNGESRNLRCNNAPSYDGKNCRVIQDGESLESCRLEYKDKSGNIQSIALLMEN